MADMQVTVGFRGEPGMNATIILAGRKVLINKYFYEVFFGSHVHSLKEVQNYEKSLSALPGKQAF
jgi:hypothetical protein